MLRVERYQKLKAAEPIPLPRVLKVPVGLYNKIKDRHSRLPASTRKKIPRYIGAMIAAIFAVGFMSTGLSYLSEADQDNFDREKD